MSVNIFKPNLLENQNVFITGASSGINKGIAEKFAEHGANLVVVARNEVKLNKACAEIAERGSGDCAGYVADVRDMDAMSQAAKFGHEKFGNYDIVIAGAAGNFLAPAEQMSANAFAAVVDIDLKGTFHTFRVCYDYLNPRSRLLAISAPQAQKAMCLQSHVCSAKAGVEMLVKTLALEWGGKSDGHRVNALVPGFVQGTLGVDVMAGAGDPADSPLLRNLAIPEFLQTSDMGDAALIMVSPAMSFLTGHVLAYDGGIATGSTERIPLPERR